MAIAGIIFDKDGTLFDFEATWSVWAFDLLTDLAAGDAALLLSLAEVFRFDPEARKFAPDSPAISETTQILAERLLPLLPDWRRDGLVAHMKQMAAGAAVVEPIPLAPLIAELKGRGLRLGVATNDNEAPARQHLSGAGVEHQFDFIAGYDSGHGGKPAPGQMLAFLSATGLAPHEVVMVGDSLHDLHAGRAAGLHTVGVLTGPARAEDLAPHADAVLPDIGHLPLWLDAQGR
jgi:phosphoglycolate phosphatase